MVTTSAERETTTVARPNRWFRGDVDGLRAIAIVLVVAYHAGIPHFSGGFIGVDVFFVISGFLISRNLLREAETEQRITLSTFWARRIRRLVPALALVVAVTLIVGAFVFPLFELGDLSKQGAAAALYVSNILFAVQANNYFAADVASSPFLHTWSLGVEEQFYLVWPVLFALVCWAGTRLPTRSGPTRRRLLVVVFGITFVSSLALSISLTDSGSTWAFFGLPSRAWEFAVAGLLAAVPVPALLRRVSLRTVMALGGLLLLAYSTTKLEATTPYPGRWALLPVLATVLLITAGETWGGTAAATPIGTVLSARPMQWLGRVSYSWYLWHWPAIVLLVVALDRDTVRVKSLAAIASLPVAWVAYKYFETPVRFAPAIARSVRRTFAFGAVVTVSVLAIALVVRREPPATANSGAFSVEAFEAPAGSSLEERVSVAVSEYRKRSDSGCPKNSLKTGDGDAYCVGGDTGSDRTVMLLGDSHAGQWRKALEEVARQRGVRLVIRQHNGCPPYPVDVRNGAMAEKTEICRSVQAGDVRVIEALKPDAVIISSWSGNGERVIDDDGNQPDRAGQAALWQQAVEERLREIRQQGVQIAMIIDEPSLPINASNCIVAKNSIEACEPARAASLVRSGAFLAAERQVVTDLGGIPTLDMTDIVCDADRCKLEIDGTLVYVDTHHLTDAFAAKMLPQLQTLMTQLIG